jgi:chromosome segregation protein
MFLKSLKLHGFKSFGRKTELVFKNGLTCIVGPNGCGKSNIVDAVRWVLGEQRPSVLRSERMDNVIFSGSKSAKPLGMAEVSIVLENTRNVLPSEYSEVMVTRRLYRSGESEYLINKTPCRLRDIQELFMDTGLGPDSYSVIELKMVESILNSKSDERLHLFEEAAGINKYKQRRSAAFRKLEATETDLNRIDDILSEVERNVNALKRQVNRAQRYKDLVQQIEELEIQLASFDLWMLLKRLRPLKDELRQREQEHHQQRSLLTREEAELERLRARALDVENRLSKVQRELMAVTEELHARENEQTASRERIRALRERAVRYQQEKEELKQRIQNLERRIEQSEPQMRVLAERVDALRMKYRLKKQELDEFDKLLARRRMELNESRQQLIDTMRILGEKEKRRNALAAHLNHLQGRREQLTTELERLKKEYGSLAGQEEDRKEEKEALKKDTEKAAQQVKKAEKELAARKEEAETVRAEIAGLENRRQALEQQRAFFRNLIQANEGLSDGLQYVLELRKKETDLLGLLADLIDVPREYRVAVEALLGEKAFYVVTRSQKQIFRLLQDLQNRRLGKVAFLSIDRFARWYREAELPSVPRSAGVLARLSDVIQAPAELQPLVHFLFGRSLVVENVDTASRLWDAAQQQGFWNLVTLQGEVFGADGAVRSGRYEETSSVSIVGREAQLRETETAIQDVEKALARARKNLEQIAAAIQKGETALEEAQRELRQKEERLRAFELEVVKKETQLSGIRDGMASAEQELTRIAGEEQTARKELEQLEPELADLQRKRRRFEDEVEGMQERLEELETQRTQLSEEVHELNLNLVKATGDLNSLENDLKRMRRAIEEARQSIVRRDQEIQEGNREMEHLAQQEERLQGMIADLQEKKGHLLRRQEELKSEMQELQDILGRKEEQLKRARATGESSAELLQELRLSISELELKIENLKQSIREKYDVDVTPVEVPPDLNMEELREKLQRLKERERTFGAVNMMALEEYNRESERLDFLYKQRNDLIEAKKTLLETIDVINRTAREKFEEVFQQIRQNFQQNFTAFFEGGEGDLRIQFDPDDPLAARIQILARPRGKQLSALELLSAGEKALTAIALLFSIYQVKPSPFCILDEVDAPLDDVNVHRFLKVLRQFSEKTQFIVVTHNKITMQAADTIYGVTMEEEGISKIVSVELSKAEEMVNG